MNTKIRKRVAAPKPGRTSGANPPASAPTITAPMFRAAKELRRWADTVLGAAGAAAELSLHLAKARASAPRQQAAIEKAGSMLRQAREIAGMTTAELSQAVDLADPALLDQAEVGKVALPFEVILRLAGVLGRHDPVTFAMKLARTYNPTLWKALDDLGVGRLAVQAGRERELANLYRANDAARRLSDKDFAAVLEFTRAGFEMAVAFRGDGPREREPQSKKPRAR